MNKIEFGDCREIIRRWAVDGVRAQTCVTSPPYFGLRTYGGGPAEIGQEATPEAFVENLVETFRGVRDLLADDGTLWLNIGDSYASGKARTGEDCEAGGQRYANRQSTLRAPDMKPKDLIGIPWMLAFALRADGWYLRQEIIWAKATSGASREGRAMPESVRDRCAKSHETIFLLAKSSSYYFDAEAIKEPAQDWGKARDRTAMRGGTTDPKLKHGGLSNVSLEKGNRRSVWRVNPAGYEGAHFAVYPPALIEPCVLAGSRPGDVVLDPFMGSGTTAEVALSLGRMYLGCELNPAYAELQQRRLRADRVAQTHLFQEQQA